MLGDWVQGNTNAVRVTEMGAFGDGKTLNTEAISLAIQAVGDVGGGTVYFPPGDYVTGTIELAPSVTLCLEGGATIWGSPNQADYTRECLIYAEDAPNVAICGRGVIDGNGTAFWVRVEGRWRTGEWRPSRMCQFLRCDNLLLEGVTFRNSPAWTIHPMDCDGVVIHAIHILNGMYEENGPNTDGIDPDACTNVRISDCNLQTGDDAIVVKITKRPGGRRECRDIVVTNCTLRSSETALKIGSETHGEFRNIAFSNCTIRDAGCGVGLWMRDGGSVDGWTVDNISMTLPKGGVAFYAWAYPRIEHDAIQPPEGHDISEYGPPGSVSNVRISNVVAEADGGAFLSGMAGYPLRDLAFSNVRIHMRGGTEKTLHAEPPYPFPVWGHHRAPFDLFARHVSGLALRDIHWTWGEPERPKWGSAIRCWHVRDLEIDGFHGRQSVGSGSPAIALRDVHGAYVHSCWAPEGTGAFIELAEGTSGVSIMQNDLARAQFARLVSADSEPPFLLGNLLPG